MTDLGPSRHAFAFAAAYRWPARLLGITPATARVECDVSGLVVRFGAWSLRTSWTNVASVELTGGFSFLKTVGPPHLSFSDRGVTFATNGDAAACLGFHRPVAGIDPTRRIKHPGATLTVADPGALMAEIEQRVRA